MGLKLLVITSLAVYLLQLSTVLPSYLSPHSDELALLDGGEKEDISEELVNSFESKVGEWPRVEANSVASEFRPRATESVEELPRGGVPTMLRDNNLAAHIIRRIIGTNQLSILCKKSQNDWAWDGAPYHRLGDEEKKQLEDHISMTVVLTKEEKNIYRLVKWSLERFGKAVWWDEKLIKESSLVDDEYKYLVAIGDLLKLHDKIQPVSFSHEELSVLAPQLHRILANDANGNLREQPLNLRLLYNVKNNEGESIYGKRILQVAPKILKNNPLEQVKMFHTLYMALGHSPKESLEFSEIAFKNIGAYAYRLRNRPPSTFQELKDFLMGIKLPDNNLPLMVIEP